MVAPEPNPLQPVPDFDRLTRAIDPSLRILMPPVVNPLENANTTVGKQSVTMNLAGTAKTNPILAGLGEQLVFYLAKSDLLKAVYVFTDRTNIGPNLISFVTLIAPNAYSLAVIHGTTFTIAGSPIDGAKLNYIRVMSEQGVLERQLFVKTQDRDIVTINGLSALGEDAETPTPITVPQVDAGMDWLDVAIDFMPSWNDEFHVLHRRGVADEERGFKKAYGGAAFVSWFDTDESEGVGDEVNPVTDQPIESLRTMQVQNTVGQKAITVRFRSKAGSLKFVDVEILIDVVAADVDECKPPLLVPCQAVLLKEGTLLPANTPDAPSVPGVQVVAGTVGVPLSQDLLYIAVVVTPAHVGTKMRLRRWGHVADAAKLDGYLAVEIGTADDYLPLKLDAFGAPPPGYNDPEIQAIALSVASETTAGVAWYTVSALDDNLESNAWLVPGPLGRGIALYAEGGLGGGGGCCGPAGCVADTGIEE